MRAVALIVGGAIAGLLIGASFTTRAQAQAPAQTARFQYKCVTGLPAQLFKQAALDGVNREGASGWQLLDGLSGQNHLSGGDQYCFVKQY